MPSVHQPELVAMMIEEALPECVVEGVDYTSVDIVEEKRPTPSFVQQFIDLSERKDRPTAESQEQLSNDVPERKVS